MNTVLQRSDFSGRLQMSKTKAKKFCCNRKRAYFCTPKKTGKWSVGQGVKTPPFHGGITGSIPVRSTGKGKVVNPNCLQRWLGFLIL
jgi:hypothetical protein